MKKSRKPLRKTRSKTRSRRRNPCLPCMMINPELGDVHERATGIAKIREDARAIYITLSNIDYTEMEEILPTKTILEVKKHIEYARRILESSRKRKLTN